jgi:flagellin
MVINHNLSAMFADRTLAASSQDLTNSMEKLSSGMRINKASDDASGLAVSEKMRSQIRGLSQANRNIQNGVSFIQTTEGYLQETQDILQRMRELSVQSANGIYNDDDRQMIQVEVSQLVDEVNRIASQAQFNGMNILTGRFASATTPGAADQAAPAAPAGNGGLRLQVGANMDQFKTIAIGNMSAGALGVGSMNLTSTDNANKAIGTLDEALKTVSMQRANLGAYQNRFENAAKGVGIAAENLQAAESRIRDTDMANEMVNYVRDQIKTQAGTAMLAQANVRSQAVLQLFR